MAVKFYDNQEIATKVATKKQLFMLPHDNKFAVGTNEELAALTPPVPTFTQTPEGWASTPEGTDEPDIVIPVKPSPTKVEGNLVTYFAEGAKLTPMYVITPVLGSKPRWFERKRLHPDTKEVDGGVQIVADIREFTSRKIADLLG